MVFLTVDFEMKQLNQQKIIVHAQLLLPKVISDFILIIHSFSLITVIHRFSKTENVQKFPLLNLSHPGIL